MVRHSLQMSIKFENPWLIRGDAIKNMGRIDDGSIDLVLCDPPYGVTHHCWDSIIPIDQMWAALKRIIKPTGAIVLTSTQPFSSKLVSSNYGMFKYDWVWKKTRSTGYLNAKKQPLRDKEDILVFYAKQCTYNPQKTQGSKFKGRSNNSISIKRERSNGLYKKHGGMSYENYGTRYPKQVLSIPSVLRGRLHPSQKPMDLMTYLIKTYTNENDNVLDFAMGVGTTGVACKKTGRQFIGIELDDAYFNIARDRINKSVYDKEKLDHVDNI